MVKDWDPLAAGFLVVSRRNGLLHVVDGMHRLAAMRRLKIQAAPCAVYDGLTYEREAQLFATLNTQRAVPLYYVVFRALLAAGVPQVLEVKRIVEAMGYTLNLSGSGTTNPTMISAIRGVEKIYRQHGEMALRDTLAFVRATWPDDADGIRQTILTGVDLFLRKWSHLDREEVRQKLSLMAPRVLLREAIARVKDSGGEAPLYICHLLGVAYNKGKRTRRLDLG